MAVLDTTLLIDLMREGKKGKRGPALKKLDELGIRNERPATTMMNVAELMTGAYLSDDRAGELERIGRVIAKMDVLEFNHPAAVRYGRVVARAREDGTPLGVIDAMIAAIAMENDETLVTRDSSGFERIGGLRVESY